jgi:hypothetical protein
MSFIPPLLYPAIRYLYGPPRVQRCCAEACAVGLSVLGEAVFPDARGDSSWVPENSILRRS